ncbi:MAG: PGPGW domain-containing protein [Glaciecola sp.]
MKYIRITLGTLLCIIGVIFTILPGSSLLVLCGLVMLSVDYAPAKKWLRFIQKSMSTGARKLDGILLSRKYK